MERDFFMEIGQFPHPIPERRNLAIPPCPPKMLTENMLEFVE